MNAVQLYPGTLLKFRFFMVAAVMEAERINSIVNALDDLAQRSSELRRYL